MSEDKNDKPIIRHCKNCKYCGPASFHDGYCTVKYKWIGNGRAKARFCKYYKAEEA